MFLLYLCTNSPLEIDDDSGGSARRTRILDLPFNFCIDPQAPNEKPIDPCIEDSFPGWRNDLFWLLWMVYQQFMQGRSIDTVYPVPNDVRETVDDELAQPWMEALDLYKAKRLVAVAKKDEDQASKAGDIRKDFFEWAGQAYPLKEISFMMSRRGFCEARVNFYEGLRRNNKRCYKVSLDGGTSLVRTKA